MGCTDEIYIDYLFRKTMENCNEKQLHIIMGDVSYYKTARQKVRPKISLDSTLKALRDNESRINTFQPSVCDVKWLKAGYTIYVHMLDNKIVKFKLRNKILAYEKPLSILGLNRIQRVIEDSPIIDVTDEDGNDVTNKEIKVVHNLSKMLLANAFGKAKEI